ncbi:hypothetical protein WH47_02365 [Habropoda laboriosa]|uniref:Uncharacterized protein n=1 Tax=Habropoda laboriosa TaxID=597456 RepID=A0A0L7RKK3_9HYME|nr:hypothetical protein WH47_02365 [Habropoda laboriosa]
MWDVKRICRDHQTSAETGDAGTFRETPHHSITKTGSRTSKKTATRKMRYLLNIMQEDWRIYKKVKNEFDVLCEQYAVGKKLTTSFAANTTSYLFQLGFNMICVSFTQFQTVINLQDTPKALRYVSVTICLLCDLLFVSWPGQRLSDYTERIFEYTTNGKWYESSYNCRKLLIIMLSKSLTSLKLTACKIYTLNLESFNAVVQTSFSYTMVLCSLQ